jgi:hypothetical protein
MDVPCLTKKSTKTVTLTENKTNSVILLNPAMTARIATSTPVTTSSTKIRNRASTRKRAEHRDRGWIAANVGIARYNSLRILNLREGATEGEVKAA